MSNMTANQARNKERARKKRVCERGDQARQLIKDALAWATDDQAVFHMASVLVCARHPKLLAAVWNELEWMGGNGPIAERARKVVREANKAIARDLV